MITGLRKASIQAISAGSFGTRATTSAAAATPARGIGTECQPSARGELADAQLVVGGEVVRARLTAPEDRRDQRRGDVVVVHELERHAGVRQNRRHARNRRRRTRPIEPQRPAEPEAPMSCSMSVGASRPATTQGRKR